MKSHRCTWWAMPLLVFSIIAPASADDLEIYTQSIGSEVLQPNVLLILDSSGSMRVVDGTSGSRMLQLREALTQVLSQVDGINLGLMRFKNPGGTVIYPITGIDEVLDDWQVVKRVKSLGDIATETLTVEGSDSGTVSIGSTSVEFTSELNDIYTGLRFTGLNLPRGAIIEEAYLTLFSRSSQQSFDPLNINIRVDQRSDSPAFSDLLPEQKVKVRFDSLPNLLPQVTWQADYWPTGSSTWTAHPLPTQQDLGPLLQALVNLPDWTEDSPVTLLLEALEQSDSRRFATTQPQMVATYYGNVDTNNSLAPILKVRYRIAAGPQMTVRQALHNELAEFTLSGDTPIADTMLEGYRYFNGWEVGYGLDRGPSANANAYVNRVSHSKSIIGEPQPTRAPLCLESAPESFYCATERYTGATPTYQSPIIDTCQRNYMVLFSDGAPSGTYNSSVINGFAGGSCSSASSCPEELSRYMGLEPGVDGKEATHKQVSLYTLGYDSRGFDVEYLSNLAALGNGGFYAASDTEGLVNAFESIFKDINESNNSFVSPGVTINQFNRLSHMNNLYFSLFRPLANTNWPGNLKKYKLTGGSIHDRNMALAVDPTNGSFYPSAQSYWSPEADGPAVAKGGAANRLPAPGQRKVVVNFSDSGNTTDITLPANEHLLTAGLLGVEPDNTELLTALRQWVKGLDSADIDSDGVLSETRAEMGDALHSRPVVVSYNLNDAEAESADLTIFAASNQGYLHAFEMSGEDQISEVFAFAPKDLLSNAQLFYEDAVTNDHVYGLDGDIVVDRDGEDINLFLGMRRGGRNYYALKVSGSNRRHPAMKFVIRGGDGGTAGYEKLGQSWSKPIVTKVQIGGSVRKVIIFGGGYDLAQDESERRERNSIGNAVYMADADTGELVWYASKDSDGTAPGTALFTSLSKMKFSIPATVSVIDRDLDGLADHLYVADLGGQVFRVDLYNGESGDDFAKGGRIAKLGNNDPGNNRRFYYPPDVAEVRFSDEHYYAVAVGSGYRAHPLDLNTRDRMYILKDKGVFGVMPGESIQFDDRNHGALFDATQHQVRGNDLHLLESFQRKKGWYIDLPQGEKILSRPIIVNHRVAFTSYIPRSVAAQPGLCLPKEGGGRLYLMDLVTSEAIVDVDVDGTLEHDDRWQDLRTPGIPPEPRIIYPDGEEPIVCVSVECGDATSTPGENNNACANGELSCLTQGFFANRNRVIKGLWDSKRERVVD